MMTFLKGLLLGAVVVLAVVVVVPLGVVAFGPLKLTDVRMLLNAATGRGIDTPAQSVVAARLQVPDGFQVNLFAADLPNVRFLEATASGDLVASRPRAGEVVLLETDRDGDGMSDGRRVLLSGLTRPHGLELWDGWLYVAESNAVGRVRFDEASGQLQGEYQRIITGLGDSGNHWTKSLRIGPDGWLYLSSGSTCNVCLETDPQRAAISRYRPDGSDYQLYATGLRNSVGLDFAPWNNALYATDNGRDLLGDDFPPCELNRIEADGFYGWPYVNDANIPDPDFGDRQSPAIARAIPPVHGFRAHNAPLGMRFLQGDEWPGFERAALVALHGSWNRSERDGYAVVSLHWRADGSVEEQPFLWGFQRGEDVIGRPVDVVLAGAAAYISDDYAGAVYRVMPGTGQPSAHAAAVEGKVAPASQTTTADGLATLTDAQRSALLTVGQAAYQDYRCADCHAAPGATGAAKPLLDLADRYNLDSLADFFLAPTPPMPRYPLTGQQRRGLAVLLLADAG